VECRSETRSEFISDRNCLSDFPSEIRSDPIFPIKFLINFLIVFISDRISRRIFVHVPTGSDRFFIKISDRKSYRNFGLGKPTIHTSMYLPQKIFRTDRHSHGCTSLWAISTHELIFFRISQSNKDSKLSEFDSKYQSRCAAIHCKRMGTFSPGEKLSRSRRVASPRLAPIGRPS